MVRFRVVVLGLSAALAACGDPVAPRPSGVVGGFGVVVSRDWQLYVIGEDSLTSERPVLPSGVSGTMPDVTADGSRIVFVHRKTAPNGMVTDAISTIAVDGTGLRTITEAGVSGLLPRWSADGSMVAYRIGRWNDTPYAALVVQAARPGGIAQYLAGDDQMDPWSSSWAPDGSEIVFTVNGGWLWAVGTGGTAPRPLTSGHGWEPDWSPDGRRVAYVGFGRVHDRLCILAIADAAPQCFDWNSRVTNPRWSPDGQWLAFLSSHEGGEFALYTMKADGSELTRRLSGRQLGSEVYDWVTFRRSLLPQ